MKSIKIFRIREGITLIELLIVLPMISVILLLVFNIFFLSNRGFKYTIDSFEVGEDLRNFTKSIQKETNQAIKSNKNTAIFKPINTGNNELCIYSDLDGDGIPELIRYKLKDNNIYRGTEKATNTDYELKFGNSFENEKIVLTHVTNTNIFGDLKGVEELKDAKGNYYVADNDHRRKISMKIEIKKKDEDMPIIIDTLLVVKSRAQYGE